MSGTLALKVLNELMSWFYNQNSSNSTNSIIVNRKKIYIYIAYHNKLIYAIYIRYDCANAKTM